MSATRSTAIRSDTRLRATVLLLFALSLLHLASSTTRRSNVRSRQQHDREATTRDGRSSSRRRSQSNATTSMDNVVDNNKGEEAPRAGQRKATSTARPTERCSRGRVRRAVGDDQLESIKSEILRKLRLSRPPKITTATRRGHHQQEAGEDQALLYAMPGVCLSSLVLLLLIFIILIIMCIRTLGIYE